MLLKPLIVFEARQQVVCNGLAGLQSVMVSISPASLVLSSLYLGLLLNHGLVLSLCSVYFLNQSDPTTVNWRWHTYKIVLYPFQFWLSMDRWQFKWFEIRLPSSFFRLSACKSELLLTEASEEKLEQFLSPDRSQECIAVLPYIFPFLQLHIAYESFPHIFCLPIWSRILTKGIQQHYIKDTIKLLQILNSVWSLQN